MGILKSIGFKTKGSSLIELLVALLIIIVLFAICTQVFVQILKSNQLNNRLNAQLLLQKELNFIYKTRDFADGQKKMEHFLIDKKTVEFTGTTNIYIFTINIRSDSDSLLLASSKELIIKEKP